MFHYRGPATVKLLLPSKTRLLFEKWHGFRVSTMGASRHAQEKGQKLVSTLLCPNKIGLYHKQTCGIATKRQRLAARGHACRAVVPNSIERNHTKDNGQKISSSLWSLWSCKIWL